MDVKKPPIVSAMSATRVKLYDDGDVEFLKRKNRHDRDIIREEIRSLIDKSNELYKESDFKECLESLILASAATQASLAVDCEEEGGLLSRELRCVGEYVSDKGIVDILRDMNIFRESGQTKQLRHTVNRLRALERDVANALREEECDDATANVKLLVEAFMMCPFRKHVNASSDYAATLHDCLLMFRDFYKQADLRPVEFWEALLQEYLMVHESVSNDDVHGSPISTKDKTQPRWEAMFQESRRSRDVPSFQERTRAKFEEEKRKASRWK